MQSKSLAFNYYDFGTREDIAYLVYITPDNIAVQNMNLMFHRFWIYLVIPNHFFNKMK